MLHYLYDALLEETLLDKERIRGAGDRSFLDEEEIINGVWVMLRQL